MTSICTQRIWNIHRIATHYEFMDYLIQTYNIINDIKNVNGVGIGENKNNNNNNTNSKNLTHDQKEHTILLLQQQMVAMVKKATVTITEQQQLLEKMTKNNNTNNNNPALAALKDAKHLLDVIQIVNNTTGGNANDGNSNATNMKNFVLHEGMPALLPMVNDLAFKQDKSMTLTTPTTQGNATKTSTTTPANNNNNNKPTHQPPIASTALPTIMLHSARIKGNVVTFMVGLELFGISPKDLAANSHFKSFMGCAVTTVDIVAEPKMKQHFPATINPKCTFMVQMQGDQTTKAAKYAVNSH
eukprot:UN04836